jgi:hypothetical protein
MDLPVHHQSCLYQDLTHTLNSELRPPNSEIVLAKALVVIEGDHTLGLDVDDHGTPGFC